MRPVLEVKNLEKTFGSVVAARDINLTIPHGQIIGIIGANGAGKTTFVNMVTGYLKPTSGQILFNGDDVTGKSPGELTRIGLTRSFQIAQTFHTLTTLENLLMAIGATDMSHKRAGFMESLESPARHKRVEEIVQHYGLQEYADQVASELPQGVRKLLDIAMAVASEPSTILLDEPTSGVSAEDKFQIMDQVIGALKEDGITTLFIEHDMDIVSRYADRVLAFVDGTVISDGTPDEVLSNEQVRTLIVGEVIERSEALREANNNA